MILVGSCLGKLRMVQWTMKQSSWSVQKRCRKARGSQSFHNRCLKFTVCWNMFIMVFCDVEKNHAPRVIGHYQQRYRRKKELHWWTNFNSLSLEKQKNRNTIKQNNTVYNKTSFSYLFLYLLQTSGWRAFHRIIRDWEFDSVPYLSNWHPHLNANRLGFLKNFVRQVIQLQQIPLV